MTYQVGDTVTRESYHHDVVFVIVKIKNETAYLKGVLVRLEADAPLEDLKKYEDENRSSDDLFFEEEEFDKQDFFYLPGRILHVDADVDYLKRCMKFYQKHHVKAVGKQLREKDMPSKIQELLSSYQPDILIITGHDAFYPKKGSALDSSNYLNTKYFVSAVKEARKFEKSHDKLIIIAGACQSNYEELILAGANFASSPKRINIHCLDPAIIALNLAKTERSEQIDLRKLLKKTKYGSSGMGGIKCQGMMYVGFPR